MKGRGESGDTVVLFNPIALAILGRRHRHHNHRPAAQPYLEHVQQRRLASVIETKEQELGVLVHQAQRGQDVVNCEEKHVSARGLS